MSLNERERLFINEIEIDLSTDESAFARTLQVNDLVNIENRQTNFTKNIKLPKTPKNIQTFDWLGVSGNVSQFPYQKNTAKYMIGNEFLIYDGWAIINQTDDFYNVSIYDGAIDLYKAIENRTLADLDISGLNHEKTLDNVVNSFTSTSTDYKYIVADYNGNSLMNSGTTLNVDYLVPATKISYLFAKIFEFAGATYEGEIFDKSDFKDTYITYLKKNEGDTINQVLHTVSGDSLSNGTGLASNKVVIKQNNISGVTGGHFSSNGESFIVDAGGVYEINWSGFIVGDVDTGSYYYANQALTVGVIVNDTYEYPISNAFTGTTQIVLSPGDSFKIYASSWSGSWIYYPLRFFMPTFEGMGFYFWMQYKYVSSSNQTATQALSEFSLKDFLNEILWKYGLTIYKDKYRNHYTFKNLSEIIDPTNYIDWSDKFISKTSEKYVYGSYSQRNRLAHKYNSQNVSYNDGFINVDNKNLDAEKTVISSKIYAQEQNKSKIFSEETNLYKYWEKEIKDDGSVDYKDLSSRFYLLKEKLVGFPAGKLIGSEKQNISRTIYSMPFDRNDIVSFNSSVNTYYSDFNKILDSARIITANIWLTYLDVIDFDFSKLYFIKQLGSYFLVNKIINFQMNKSTSVELIQINDVFVPTAPPEPEPPKYLTIDSITTTDCKVTITYNTNVDLPADVIVYGMPNSFGVIPPPIMDADYYYGGAFTATGTTNTITVDVLAGQYWQFYLEIPSELLQSNTLSFYNGGTCLLPLPEPPELTYITITSVEQVSINTSTNTRRVKIHFNSDLVLPNSLTLNTYDIDNFSLPITYPTVVTNYIVADVPYIGKGFFGDKVIGWLIGLVHGDVSSNTVNVIS